MPRLARKNIETPFVHVMVQGINKEYIFNEKKFLLYYLHLIKQKIKPESFELLAYCMMDNHAHFLFFINDVNAFEKYMKSNNQKFAQKYNKENDRYGVVFRNRYKVEPIYDIKYLSNCIKYIHNNPVKAGIVKECKDYEFSSYNEFLHGNGVSQSQSLKSVFGDCNDLLELICDSNDRRFIDVEDVIGIEDSISEGTKAFFKCSNYEWIHVLSDRNVLKKLIFFLKNDYKIKYGEIMQYFSISKSVMDSIVKNN